MPSRVSALAGAVLIGLPIGLWAQSGTAQEPLPWQRPGYQQGYQQSYQQPDDAYRPGYDAYSPRYSAPKALERDSSAPGYGSDAYQPPRSAQGYGQPYYPQQPRTAYGQQPYSDPAYQGYGQTYSAPPRGQYGEPYAPPPDQAYNDRSYQGYGPPPGNDRYYGPPRYHDGNGYSSNEILTAGHTFFGSVSKGLASVVEYAFKSKGRPNGYILGEEAGGAFIAGLRYGEGVLYTKYAGTHRVYWQGPSIGYDVGAEGSKVMVLVYHLADPRELYQRFGGVDGSAYIVGGVGLTFLSSNDVVVAPIRAGVGLRLGANIGYLKYTRTPTWNPF